LGNSGMERLRLSEKCNFGQLAKPFLGHSRKSRNPMFSDFSGLPLPRE
jgi:hypothetical protein